MPWLQSDGDSIAIRSQRSGVYHAKTPSEPPPSKLRGAIFALAIEPGPHIAVAATRQGGLYEPQSELIRIRARALKPAEHAKASK